MTGLNEEVEEEEASIGHEVSSSISKSLTCTAGTSTSSSSTVPAVTNLDSSTSASATAANVNRTRTTIRTGASYSLSSAGTSATNNCTNASTPCTTVSSIASYTSTFGTSPSLGHLFASGPSGSRAPNTGDSDLDPDRGTIHASSIATTPTSTLTSNPIPPGSSNAAAISSSSGATRRSRRSASTTGLRSRISLDEDSVRALVEQEEQRLRSRREQAFAADQRKDWTLPSSHSGSSFSGTSSHSIHSFNKERDNSTRRSITRQAYSVTGATGTSSGNAFAGIGPFASGSISAANTPGTEESDHLTFPRHLHTAQSHHHHLHHHHMPHSQGSSSREGRSSSSSLGTGAIPNGIIRTSTAWLQRKIHLRPQLRGIHLITDELLKQLPELADFLVGLCHIQVMHTSASLALNEVTYIFTFTFTCVLCVPFDFFFRVQC